MTLNRAIAPIISESLNLLMRPLDSLNDAELRRIDANAAIIAQITQLTDCD